MVLARLISVTVVFVLIDFSWIATCNHHHHSSSLQGRFFHEFVFFFYPSCLMLVPHPNVPPRMTDVRGMRIRLMLVVEVSRLNVEVAAIESAEARFLSFTDPVNQRKYAVVRGKPHHLVANPNWMALTENALHPWMGFLKGRLAQVHVERIFGMKELGYDA
ncbi:hypothetical protein LINGRAHAP2_LOCUS34600 [Linum grandiflorum]